jgi:hypothetical protein
MAQNFEDRLFRRPQIDEITARDTCTGTGINTVSLSLPYVPQFLPTWLGNVKNVAEQSEKKKFSLANVSLEAPDIFSFASMWALNSFSLWWVQDKQMSYVICHFVICHKSCFPFLYFCFLCLLAFDSCSFFFVFVFHGMNREETMLIFIHTSMHNAFEMLCACLL